MRHPARLSLRARMLVLLIGVTTMFLLVMGIVGTFVLNKRLTGNFNASLGAAATRRPAQLAAGTGGYAAVEVVRPGGTIRLVTSSTPETRALAAAVGRLSHAALAAHVGGPLFEVEGNDILFRAAARQVLVRSPGPRLRLAPAILVVARPVRDVTGQVRAFVIAELITGSALIALLAIGGEWLIGRGLEPLDQMASTAHEITVRGDLNARMTQAGDRTEVGRLGSAINTMLDRIQQAFGARLLSEQKVREFAADASHELRTPLTTIRGYAELYRQGALGPDQLPTAMRRIEQEADRMSTLVAELLELARLDRTSSLDLTETDLAAVVRDAVADAIAVEPGRPVRAEAPPRLVAVVDEPRIRQVLANMLGNVRAHTPPATPVAVRLGEVSGGVLIEVADAGPGMSAEDASRAFDRFHRATQPDGGEPGRGSDAQPEGTRAGGGSGPGGDGGGADRSGSHGAGGAPEVAKSPGGWSRGSGPANPGSGWAGSGPANPGSGWAGSGPANPGSGWAGSGPANPGSGRPGVGGGSGLGLSIVQAIARAHGGQAALESWPGRGTRVRIWLPARNTP
jgi:signal transduction histidine kinase